MTENSLQGQMAERRRAAAVLRGVEARFAATVHRATGATVEVAWIGRDHFSICTDTAHDLETARGLLDQGFQLLDQQEYPEDDLYVAVYAVPS